MVTPRYKCDMLIGPWRRRQSAAPPDSRHAPGRCRCRPSPGAPGGAPASVRPRTRRQGAAPPARDRAPAHREAAGSGGCGRALAGFRRGRPRTGRWPGHAPPGPSRRWETEAAQPAVGGRHDPVPHPATRRARPALRVVAGHHRLPAPPVHVAGHRPGRTAQSDSSGPSTDMSGKSAAGRPGPSLSAIPRTARRPAERTGSPRAFRQPSRSTGSSASERRPRSAPRTASSAIRPSRR